MPRVNQQDKIDQLAGVLGAMLEDFAGFLAANELLDSEAQARYAGYIQLCYDVCSKETKRLMVNQGHAKESEVA